MFSEKEKVPLVSVWMVTYNHEKYIRQSLESIVTQKTDFAVEIVIGEDCSTDNTRAIIQEFEQSYPHIIKPIYHQKNVGAFRNAYEFVYPKLRGKYIACLEGDDYWTDPLKLQKQVDFLEEHPDYSMCFHNANEFHVHTGTFVQFAELQEREYNGEEFLKDWIIPTASVLFRADKLSLVQLLNPNYIFQDIILFLSLAETGKIWCINENMCVYRKHETGETHGGFTIPKLRRFIEHHQEIAKNFGGTYRDIEKSILAKLLFELTIVEIKSLSPRSIISFFKSLSYNPPVVVNQYNQLSKRAFKKIFKGK